MMRERCCACERRAHISDLLCRCIVHEFPKLILALSRILHRITSFTTNICARDRAIVATRNMFPEEGKKCVCDVFDAAVRDYAPFWVGGGGGGGTGPRTSSCSPTFSSSSFASPPSPSRRSER